MTDRAATLTYYAMMSLFPALLVGVTLLGLFGQQGLVTDATNYLARPRRRRATRPSVVTQGPAEHGQRLGRRARGHAGGLGAARASTARPAPSAPPGRALNVVYGVEESRGMVRRKLTDLATALVVIVLFAVVLAAIFLGGQIADDLFGKIGLGLDCRDDLVLRALAGGAGRGDRRLRDRLRHRARHRAAPDPLDHPGRRRRRRCCGSCSRSASRSTCATSRAMAPSTAPSRAAIVLLLWLYLSANAFLFGAELNAELERSAGPRRSRRRLGSPPADAASTLAVGQLRRVGAQARAPRAGGAQPAVRHARPPGRRRPAAAPRRRAARRRASPRRPARSARRPARPGARGTGGRPRRPGAPARSAASA